MPTQADYAKINIACKELGLNKQDTIAMNCNGKTSSRELNSKELAKLYEVFKQRGWRPQSPSQVKSGRQATKKVNDNYRHIPPGPAAKQQRYCLALWAKLGYEVKKLDSRCHQQFGIDRIEWVTEQEHLHILITDLKKRCESAGIDPSQQPHPQHTPPLREGLGVGVLEADER